MLTASSQERRLKVIMNSICNYWRTTQVHRVKMFFWVDKLIGGSTTIHVFKGYGTFDTVKLP